MKFSVAKILGSIIVLGVLYFSLSSNSTGVVNGSVNGCSCHGSKNGGTILSLSGLPSSGYTPGASYACTLSVYSSGFVEAGFALSCDSGMLSAVGTGITLASGNKEIYHNTPKALSSSNADFTFTWTAPSSGAVVFSYAGNAVNGNNQTSFDIWNQDTTILLPAGGLPLPSVNTNYNVNVASTTAQISSMINANGSTTTTTCKYGLTSALGSTQNATPLNVSGNTAQAQICSLTNLTPNTKYYYRISATSLAGTAQSIDTFFITTPITNVNDLERELLINYYAGQLNIKHLHQPSKILVYTNAGLLVRQVAVGASKESTVDLRNLSAGYYVVQVIGQNSGKKVLPILVR
jgi:hypothetical protein